MVMAAQRYKLRKQEMTQHVHMFYLFKFVMGLWFLTLLIAYCVYRIYIILHKPSKDLLDIPYVL